MTSRWFRHGSKSWTLSTCVWKTLRTRDAVHGWTARAWSERPGYVHGWDGSTADTDWLGRHWRGCLKQAQLLEQVGWHKTGRRSKIDVEDCAATFAATPPLRGFSSFAEPANDRSKVEGQRWRRGAHAAGHFPSVSSLVAGSSCLSDHKWHDPQDAVGNVRVDHERCRSIVRLDDAWFDELDGSVHY